jgi:hypothetical protein
VTPENIVGPFMNMAFIADDVQKTCEELSARGEPPQTESWGTSAIFRDPDGNSFVISHK